MTLDPRTQSPAWRRGYASTCLPCLQFPELWHTVEARLIAAYAEYQLNEDPTDELDGGLAAIEYIKANAKELGGHDA